MSTIYFFVGPYVECRSPEDIWPEDPGLGDAWDALLNDRKRMEWNLPLSNTRTIQVGGAKIYQ